MMPTAGCLPLSALGGAQVRESHLERAMTRAEEAACLDGYMSELEYLVRTLERMGVDSADVEDLSQEVFVVLHRNWLKFDQSRDLRPFLFGIAFRVASSYRRRRWRETPNEAIDTIDNSLTPDRAYEAKQAKALVLSALQAIPLYRRAVLVMHDLDLVPAKEISAVLSIPLFTVYSRLRKARVELMHAIEDARSARRMCPAPVVVAFRH